LLANPPQGGTHETGNGNRRHLLQSEGPDRVADLDALLAALREEGCDVLEATEGSEYGKFGWVIDPEGNKVELWEPPEGQ